MPRGTYHTVTPSLCELDILSIESRPKMLQEAPPMAVFMQLPSLNHHESLRLRAPDRTRKLRSGHLRSQGRTSRAAGNTHGTPRLGLRPAPAPGSRPRAGTTRRGPTKQLVSRDPARLPRPGRAASPAPAPRLAPGRSTAAQPERGRHGGARARGGSYLGGRHQCSAIVSGCWPGFRRGFRCVRPGVCACLDVLPMGNLLWPILGARDLSEHAWQHMD